MDFPHNFVFGTATAAAQVEGAALEDGRGPSVWDTFAARQGCTANGDTPAISCDQYHRYRDDVRWMKELGLNAYRFSFSWSRILPTGRGKVNTAGVDYYKRLIDELRANDIEPWPTIFHWDTPQALEAEIGGWTSPEMPGLFAEYARTIVEQLGNRLSQVFTTNEFGNFTNSGYGIGGFAPGRKECEATLRQIRHHAILAHGMAVRAIRQASDGRIQVGVAEDVKIPVPLIPDDEGLKAAQLAARQMNASFFTPIIEGAYPAEYLAELPGTPEFTEEEMAIISTPLDFVGINEYRPDYIRPRENALGFEIVDFSPCHPSIHAGWFKLGPEVAYWGPRQLKEFWGVDRVYLVENGCAGNDRLNRDGEVMDTQRIMYLRNHLLNAALAIKEGYPLHGYFAWSLLDNFEWASGFGPRFGLLHTDFHSLERTPKASYHYYQHVIRDRKVL